MLCVCEPRERDTHSIVSDKPHLGTINILGLFIASYGTRG